MALATLDFETDEILDRPDYPPIPVGVAIRFRGKSEYLAWGHPSENNCTLAQARKRLKQSYKESDSVIFHNASFDIYVGMKHLGLPFPKEFEDTMILAYLHDPRDKSLALKPLANKYLDMPPDEQTKLKEWILANIPAAKKKPSTWGAYISKAPGKLVGKYAKGDVIRTEKLFHLFMPHIIESDMYAAYEREKKIIRVVEEHMSSQGIRVATRRLKNDLSTWEKNYIMLDKKLRRKLKCGKDVNLNSSAQLADAMDYAGLIDKWIMTEPSSKFPNGQRSTKRDNLSIVCKDKDVLDIIEIKGILDTCITTFGGPWLETAVRTGGYIYPSFNPIRATDEYGGKGVGTKTGRFSSSNPNLQNVPKAFEDVPAKFRKYLPLMRDYLVPDKGCVFVGRDYSQQELRILAHYEDGVLMDRYVENPTLDIHELLRQLIFEHTGILYDRKPVKVTGFGIIYGMGLVKLAKALDMSGKEEARILRDAYYKSLPGVKALSRGLRNCANNDEPIRTWGGREYYVEDPRVVNGHMRSFEYKLLNLLIQGSAADCTKEAMIRYYERSKHGRLTVQIHDEMLVNVPTQKAKVEMRILKECMESVEFDVPMLSDGKRSGISWHQMKKWG